VYVSVFIVCVCMQEKNPPTEKPPSVAEPLHGSQQSTMQSSQHTTCLIPPELERALQQASGDTLGGKHTDKQAHSQEHTQQQEAA
jgi:hypothetical protein